MRLGQLSKVAMDALHRNSPVILTGAAVAGVLSTAVLTARATEKAVRVKDNYVEANLGMSEQLSPKELLSLTWKIYIPSVVAGGVTVACIIGANSINSKRNAALLGLYTLTDTAFSEYKEKVVETVGKKTEEKIRDSVAQDRFVKNEDQTKEVVLIGSSDVLCYESHSGRYFVSSMEKIRKAMNDINEKCINNMYASQNEFYQKLGLDPNSAGETLGWSTENMMDLHFTSILSSEGKPCLAIDYVKSPVPNYYRIW